MSSLSNYGERFALNATTNAVSGNTPSNTRYVALYTAAPNDGGGGTEVSGNNYSRKNVAFAPASTDVGTGVTTATNVFEVLFDVAIASWGTISAMAIFDSLTGGNMLWYANLASPKIVGVNDQFRFVAGGIVLTMA
jgi:hypothetical protein